MVAGLNIVKIKYGNKTILQEIHSYIRHSITQPSFMIKSYKKIDVESLACMMVVKDEQDTVFYALDSLKHLKPRLIVVDKNGDTLPIIKEYADLFDYDADYYVKPNLDLRDSREFALSKLDEELLIVLDGDEVLSFAGTLKVFNSAYENGYIRTQKNVVLPCSEEHDFTPMINNGYHNFLLHNNGTLRIPNNIYNDLPIMRGRGIHLYNPVIWNIHYWKPNLKKWSLDKLYYNEDIQGKIPEQVKWARRDYYYAKNKQQH